MKSPNSPAWDEMMARIRTGGKKAIVVPDPTATILKKYTPIEPAETPTGVRNLHTFLSKAGWEVALGYSITHTTQTFWKGSSDSNEDEDANEKLHSRGDLKKPAFDATNYWINAISPDHAKGVRHARYLREGDGPTKFLDAAIGGRVVSKLSEIKEYVND